MITGIGHKKDYHNMLRSLYTICFHCFDKLNSLHPKNDNWNRTQKILSQHAAFALHNLFSLFRQIELTTSQKHKLFDTMVGSVLNYSAEVWGK